MAVTQAALRWRRRVLSCDDSGSIFLAMLLVLIGSALAALMVPALLIQLNSTNNDARRLHALNAAQSGIDAVIGQIRAANDNTYTTDGSLNGELGGLPCGTSAANAVPATPGLRPSSYSVTVSYFASDPRGQTSSWLTNNAIPCVSGAGARNAPSFALIVAKGADVAYTALSSAATRTLQATYVFKTTNQNIPGGLIHVFKTSTSTDLCLDAGSANPAAGTQVTLQACNEGSAQQTFAYNSSLTLALVSSQTTATPLGMCLDGGSSEAINNVIVFQPCASTTKPQQQWSLNDVANLAGTSDGASLNAYCFNVKKPNVVSSQVILSTNCNSSNYDNVQTWSPEATVGAGAAGAASGEVVNYKQFGRCLDVTSKQVSSTFLIAWPCKQAPNPDNVAWNQRWVLPKIGSGSFSATGGITTNPGDGSYCLQSPNSTAAGAFVLVTSSGCSANPSLTNLKWTVYGDTGSYATSYVIRDGYGNCLTPSDPDGPNPQLDTDGNNVSKIVVAACNGSTLQKWNAPPDVQTQPVKDVGEK